MRRLDLMPSGPYLPTASELHRAQDCVAVWALGLPEVRETNEWAEFGHKNHRYSERLVGNGNVLGHWDTIVQGVDDATKALLENVYTLLHIDLGDAKAFRWPDGFTVALRAEIGIKWRPGLLADEAQQCKRAPGERLRGWFAGTADLVYVRHDGVLLVADWKFGAQERVYGEPAKDSCQGFFLATAFAALLGIQGSSAGVVVARFERRMVSEDGIEVDGYDITQGDLDGFAEQLRGLAKRIETGVGAQPRISAACGKCKAKAGCPAWEAFDLQIQAQALENALVLDNPPETREQARTYRDAIATLKRRLSDAEEQYKAYLVLNKDGVSIGLGMREVGRKVERPNLVSTQAAQDAIRAKWGDAAFVAKPSIGCIEAVEKAKMTTKSAADWEKKKASIRDDMGAMGLLLAPSISIRATIQRLEKEKWVDVRSADEEDKD